MNISDLSLFIRIAETGSISESARQLGITTAAASSALKRLEKQLDIQLFIRTTRQLRITPQGEKYIYHCRKALKSLEQGEKSAHELQGDIRGKLRFSVSSDLGRNTVLPWIDEMLESHPLLSIDLSVSDTLSDFYMDQVDVALRYGELEDSSMVSFQIARVHRITCASPDYLSKHGIPLHPEDLRQHNCLVYRLGGQYFNYWEYMKNSENFRIKVNSNRTSNDTDIIKRWALAGKGIAYRSPIDISSDLLNGMLVEVLSDFQPPPIKLHLLCPNRKQVTPTVIAIRDMLREKCAGLIGSLN